MIHTIRARTGMTIIVVQTSDKKITVVDFFFFFYLQCLIFIRPNSSLQLLSGHVTFKQQKRLLFILVCATVYSKLL